ncbi:MAG TPA: ornithine carbamoyltransferase [Myxococcaceae bacterium]|nr:ornithine carbamoyltransferase [Myxococcaceae bacterium]
MIRHYLQLNDLPADATERLLKRASALKAMRATQERVSTLAGRHLVCLFEKNSTRTRLSFEAAMLRLGGTVSTISSSDSQISRGESIEDTARVVSRYADVIMLRTSADARLQAFAAASRVPVINGLSEGGHPVQLLADVLTIRERLGSVEGKRVAWLGDGACNMARSFAEAAAYFGFELRVGAPDAYQLPGRDSERVLRTSDPFEAVAGADVVVTDTWTSMGFEQEAEVRLAALGPYQLNAEVLAKAAPHAIVLHCLPAHRGEEITDEVLDGPQSAAWDEAENRLWAQAALLETLLGAD